jgi:hypothetical protein
MSSARLERLADADLRSCQCFTADALDHYLGTRSIDLLHDTQCNASHELFELCGYPSPLLNLSFIYTDPGSVLTRTQSRHSKGAFEECAPL